MNEFAPARPVPVRPARPGPGIGADGSYTLPGQIAAFVLGLLTTLLCPPMAVVAALLYTRAEERFAAGDPGRARRLVVWSWLSVTVLPLALTGSIVAAVFAIKASGS
ncbi:hypothetical protein [Actinomadura roseirufa]|uniref:hypothetical protein n=1 Tax=Actinomadura roseirufa TaxID=2094049 RepID=UPI0010419A59|nr:hypothetical protein [Actinomadura roseirufa]